MTLTYNGATAGSTIANPPVLAESFSWNGSIQNSPGQTGAKLWFYSSTNVVADLISSGAIADGYALGMRPGDLVFGVTDSAGGSTTPIAYFGVVAKVSSGTSRIFDASSGAALSSNFLSSTMVTSA